MTNRDRWHDVERLYHAALSRDEGQRASFVREACGGNEMLRLEVESLLAYDGDARLFLETSAIDAVSAGFLSSDAMAGLLIGERLGPYEIHSLLGAGGMGDVFRARDTRLGRDVAIKILPDAFTADPARRARFEREARLLASLNHPHIAAIYGLEERGAIHALVLELVEGPTLAERLQSGPLPLPEALTIGRQIADALEAAHDKGIVHRDLKPSNIVLQGAPGAAIQGPRALRPREASTVPPSDDVTVKVLDFGVAKVRADASSLEPEARPAAGAGETQDGLILGTAAYMSPEQARGRAVDKRSDIWAFGCLLFEMLTGRRAFVGDTVPDTLAAVLEREPAWALLPPATPPTLSRLLRRCLEKDPRRRLHDIADARLEIDDVVGGRETAGTEPVPASRSAPRGRIAIGAVVILATLAVAAVVVAIYQRRAPEGPGVSRLSIFTPAPISAQLSATISPDGRQLAFVSVAGSGRLMLWVRALDSLDARVLPGTENAAHPFWSPDNRSLGFLADGKLKTIAATGGPVETLASSPERSGPSWSRDGVILFLSQVGELGTIPATGGPVTTVIGRDPSGRQATWPHFLPDGRHFLYFVRSSRAEERGVWLGSLDSPERRRLLQTECKAAYASGDLFFMRGETLMAQPFDLNRLELSGSPSRVAEGIWTSPGAAQASFSVSQTGVLAYVNAAWAHGQFSWFDRAGRFLGRLGAGGGRSYTIPQLAPDGKRLAIAQGPAGNEHIWLFDVDGRISSRITFGQIRDAWPVWSPDGRRIAYRSSREQASGLYVKDVGGASDTLVLESGGVNTLEDWSADGRHLVYTARGQRALSDLWLLPLGGGRRPVPFLETTFNKSQAQVSPDSRWIAYTSYESGADEVYVDTFPTPGHTRQVSNAGGVQPRWRQDGRELFFVAPDGRLMGVPVKTGAAFEAGAPVELFKSRLLPHGSQSIGLPTLYDVSPDGKRFLCVIPPDDPGPPITVVLNWTAALK